MTEYQVAWKMPIEAENPIDAAKQALGIQRDPHSIATVFIVKTDDEKWVIDVEDPNNPVVL